MEVLNQATKILVIQTAFIGDAILTLPLIQEIKNIFPDSKIDVLAIPKTYEIFSHSSSVDYIYIYDKHKTEKSLFNFFSLVTKIRSNKYDFIFSPHRSFRTSLIVLFSKAKKTFGFSNSGLPFAFNNIIKYDKNSHEVKRNLDLIKDFRKNNIWKIFPEIFVSIETKFMINKFLDENKINDKLIAVAPGSVWNTKIYPSEYYVEIIKYLIANNFFILLIGGKEDNIVCEKININLTNNVLNLCGKFSIIETIELLKHCRLLISNDSAPTHFGMCANIPVLTLYCSTIPDFGFYPYNDKSDYLSYDELDCKPCGIHGHNQCPRGHFKCANLLLPKIVIQKINDMLSLNN